MDRRTALKAMLGGGLGILGCKEKQQKPLQTVKRLNMSEKLLLFDALCVVECSIHPRDYNDFSDRLLIKPGKHGEEGPLQITKQYVDDIERIAGRHLSYEARWYMTTCRGMVLMYWDHYATVERLGKEPTLEDLARIHNGGPNGWRKESTKGYWVKVKRELERMEG